MKFYVQLDSGNIIRDIIEYEHPGYISVEAELPLPVGINGGWFKLEDGKFVEYPELRPNKDTLEMTEVKLAIAELAEAQQTDKIEMQLAITELAEIVTGGV